VVATGMQAVRATIIDEGSEVAGKVTPAVITPASPGSGDQLAIGGIGLTAGGCGQVVALIKAGIGNDDEIGSHQRLAGLPRPGWMATLMEPDTGLRPTAVVIAAMGEGLGQGPTTGDRRLACVW
jgi:hypothetical protein